MKIQDWYLPNNKTQKTALHWELFKYCRTRSIALLGDKKKERFKNIGDIGVFRRELQAKYSQDNPNWDFYASIEHLAKTSQTNRKELREQLDEGLSVNKLAEKHSTFTESIEKRKERLENNELEKTVYFPANYEKHWNNYRYDPPCYDLVFDIDGDHIIDKPEEKTRKQIVQAAHTETAKIVEYLRKQNTPFYIKLSGNRGFHVGIPREKIKDYIDNNNYSETGSRFAKFIEDQTEATHIDYNIYKNKQIYRVPYSMHTTSNLICMPLTDKQFNNFELKYASPDYIRNNIEIKNRGLCTRNGKANKVIKQFKDWEKQNNLEEISKTSGNNSSKSTRVEKLLNQYNALSRKEKKQFMDQTGGLE